ncbi:putative O-methyltransferase YrrM [Amycolatopsis sulphurea]|uniref:Putative O-methyltransferase YrrM n=1 Tax=Amycolatopsis sulphurea TaxID=76022 RepID=A0A2A9FE92_9PSEU|nr:O-methyltransferase [Amycolatopsis sulphurea]PFG49684.1 putative O-methyltransferase YrrM [Amycolatopsis sulphurea]
MTDSMTSPPAHPTLPTDYIRAVLGPRDAVLDGVLRESLLQRSMPTIQIDDNAGRLLQLFTQLRKPARALEIGTLFGYSAIHIARGLPPGGRLTTIDNDPVAAELARANLVEAGVADRVDVVVGNATEYLATLTPASVGLIFIDADKKAYPAYLKACYPLLEDDGLLIADDAFAQGDFSAENDAGDDSRERAAIHAYNVAVSRAAKLFSAFVGTENGLMVSQRRVS